MNLKFIFLLTLPILIFVLALLSHQPPKNLQLVNNCDSFTQICVACLTTSSFRENLPVTQIHLNHPHQFWVVASQQKGLINQKDCSGYISLVNLQDFGLDKESLLLFYPEQSINIIQASLTKLSFQHIFQVDLPASQDFVVFYRSRNYKSISITIENDNNLQTLKKISKVFIFSVAISLLFKVSLSKIGKLRTKGECSDICLELFILGCNLVQYWGDWVFEGLFLIEVMTLVYMLLKGKKYINRQKIVAVFVTGILGFWGSVPLFLAELMTLMFLRQIQKKHLIVFFEVVLSTLLFCELISLFIDNDCWFFISTSWKLIILPLTLLAHQIDKAVANKSAQF